MKGRAFRAKFERLVKDIKRENEKRGTSYNPWAVATAVLKGYPPRRRNPSGESCPHENDPLSTCECNRCMAKSIIRDARRMKEDPIELAKEMDAKIDVQNTIRTIQGGKARRNPKMVRRRGRHRVKRNPGRLRRAGAKVKKALKSKTARRVAGDAAAAAGVIASPEVGPEAADAGLMARRAIQGNPERREIPEGKALVATYDEVNDSNRAVVTVHAEKFSPTVRVTVRLVSSTPGFEPAGSLARWTNGFWAVWWYAFDGARHGQRYLPNAKGQADATRHFEDLTEPKKVSARNPSDDADSTMAHELALFAINDGGLYRRRALPIIKNLARKEQMGTYDGEKAIVAWRHEVDEVVKLYDKEFGLNTRLVKAPTRNLAARELRDYYDEQVQLSARGLVKPRKNPVVEGAEATAIEYVPTRGPEKGIPYRHEIGEETGERPRIRVKRGKTHDSLHLVGGAMKVKPTGIHN